MDAQLPAPPRFVPPLIVSKDALPRGTRLRDAILTVVLWCVWLYLLLGAIGALLFPPLVQLLLPVARLDNRWTIPMTMVLCTGVAMTLIGLLLLRVVRERRRYGGVDRRLGRSDADDATVAAELGLDPARLPAVRAARAIVVEYDEGGHIIRIGFAT